MSLKKNKQTFRGLSHQEKLKKVQKLTKVPLQNLKTNFTQSDLEQDDVSVPISLHISTNLNYSTQNKLSRPFESNTKLFDQQTVNRTIRAMTKQLYSFEMEKQKQQISEQLNQEAGVSIFSLQDFSFDLAINSNKGHPTKDTLQNFYSTSKNHYSTNLFPQNQLLQISAKLSNEQNMIRVSQQKTKRNRNLYDRQTQPINIQQEIHPIKNLFSPKLDLKKKTESMQSKVSKRFSRSKRDSEQLKQMKIQKKPKFNRSNKKKNVLNHIADKQNIGNIYTTKTGLLSERLSYQHIPAYETIETGLKKRKNIGKNFITFQKQNIQNDVTFQNKRMTCQKGMIDQKRNSLKRWSQKYDRISKNELFKLLQQGNTEGFLKREEAADFVEEMFREYRQTIDLLRSLS